MLSIVLCGGQSTRMGSDKGLLSYRSKRWSQIAFDKLKELELPVVISLNDDQYTNYSTIFSPVLLIKDDSSLQVRGPLLGLLSVHLRYPEEDLLVLACDMLLIKNDLLKELLTQYQLHEKHDAFIFLNDGEAEPLCGIYKASALKRILHLCQNNRLSKHSMKYCLEQIDIYSIPLSDDQKKYFQNFNSREELNDL